MTVTLKQIAEALPLKILVGEEHLEGAVSGGYAGDLLSDVLAHAQKGQVWVTLQTHTNIVAVASAKELSAIILVNGRAPEEATLRKAAEEEIPIGVSSLSTYDVVCRLCKLGVMNAARV
jgi:hypothetical protein